MFLCHIFVIFIQANAGRMFSETCTQRTHNKQSVLKVKVTFVALQPINCIMMDHELGDLLNHQCGGCRITRRPRDVENVS